MIARDIFDWSMFCHYSDGPVIFHNVIKLFADWLFN